MKRTLLLCVALAALGAGCATASQAAQQLPTTTQASVEPVVADTPDDVPFNGSVWVIGDSITVGAADKFVVSLPDAVVNAEVGRKFSKGIAVLTDMLEQAAAPDVLVFALGTNNGATPEQVDEVLALASDVDRIIFVNVVVPRGWETGTNEALDQAEAKLDKVSVVDWYATAAGEKSLLRSDGFHPNADGSELWASLIAAMVTG